MVTGFNTDVEHEGKVYHVQTEDKGLENPIIETLIYRGGEILATRRSSYSDLLTRGSDERKIAGRIEAQHNDVIADVRAGHFEVRPGAPFGAGIISKRSFDEVVLDYLKSQSGADGIALQLLGGNGFVPGQTASLDLQVRRARSGEGLAGARVKVKLISTVAKPRILAQGETGEGGRLRLTCDLPVIDRGTAALIIQATSGCESAELKRVLYGRDRESGR